MQLWMLISFIREIFFDYFHLFVNWRQVDSTNSTLLSHIGWNFSWSVVAPVQDLIRGLQLRKKQALSWSRFLARLLFDRSLVQTSTTVCWKRQLNTTIYVIVIHSNGTSIWLFRLPTSLEVRKTDHGWCLQTTVHRNHVTKLLAQTQVDLTRVLENANSKLITFPLH